VIFFINENNLTLENGLQHAVDISGSGGKSGGRLFKGGRGNGKNNEGDFDYFSNEGGGWLDQVYPENYCTVSIHAVLGEWCQSILVSPVLFQNLVTLSCLSSQELSKLLHLRKRFTFENCPWSFKNPFLCRLLADTSFIIKFILDQFVCILSAITYQYLCNKKLTLTLLCLCYLRILFHVISHSFVFWFLTPLCNFNLVHNSFLRLKYMLVKTRFQVYTSN